MHASRIAVRRHDNLVSDWPKTDEDNCDSGAENQHFCKMALVHAGAKAAVIKAVSDGVVVAMGAEIALVQQHASILEHWLHTDALYGVQYVKVSGAATPA